MWFKQTTSKVNNAVDTANKTIDEVGKSAKKMLDNSNEAVNDFSNKTNAVIWTVVGCIAVTTITNLILLGFSLKMSHHIKAPMANKGVGGETIRIILGGKK